MKVLVMSDLHLEMGHVLTLPANLTEDVYDLVILAGDIQSPRRGRRSLGSTREHLRRQACRDGLW